MALLGRALSSEFCKPSGAEVSAAYIVRLNLVATSEEYYDNILFIIHCIASDKWSDLVDNLGKSFNKYAFQPWLTARVGEHCLLTDSIILCHQSSLQIGY